jgi:hypothetical protein
LDSVEDAALPPPRAERKLPLSGVTLVDFGQLFNSRGQIVAPINFLRRRSMAGMRNSPARLVVKQEGHAVVKVDENVHQFGARGSRDSVSSLSFYPAS